MTYEEVKTIIKNGGASIKNGKVTAIKSGYMASFEASETKIKLNKNYARVLYTINKYIKEHCKNYVGVWVDNGLVYVDVSKRFNTKKECLDFAKANHQLAIYCNNNNKTIRL